MKNTRTQRSASELIAASQLQLANRIARAERKSAIANPEFKETVDAIEAVTVAIREAKKLAADGPQSAKVRIQKHQVWITRIQQELEISVKGLPALEKEKIALETTLSNKIGGSSSQVEQPASAVQNTLGASD